MKRRIDRKRAASLGMAAAAGTAAGALASPFCAPAITAALSGGNVVDALVGASASLMASGSAQGYALLVAGQFAGPNAPGAWAGVAACIAVLAASALRPRFDAEAERDGTPLENVRVYRGRDAERHSWLWHSGEAPRRSGVVVGYYSGSKAFAVAPANHALIIAPSGGGKSRGSAIPTACMLAKRKASIVITDPSRELYLYLARYLRSEGYEVVLVSVSDPASGSPVDFLAPIKDALADGRYDVAQERAKSFGAVLSPDDSVENSVFSQGAAGLIAAVAYAVCELPEIPSAQRTMATVVALINDMAAGELGNEQIKEWISSLPDGHPSKRMAGIYMAARDRQLASTASKVMQSLNPFIGRGMAWLTGAEGAIRASGSIVDTGRPRATFITMAPGKAPANALVSLFLSQMWDAAKYYGGPHGEGLRETWALLDEAHCIPQWDVVSCVEQSRKYGLHLVFYYQGVSSLSSVGPRRDEAADAVLANCDAKVLYRAGSLRDAELFEKLGGKRTVKAQSAGISQQTRSAVGSTSATYSEREVPNWPTSELMSRDPSSDGVLLFQQLNRDPKHSGRFVVPMADASDTFLADELDVLASKELEELMFARQIFDLGDKSRGCDLHVETWWPESFGDDGESVADESGGPVDFGI